MWMVYGMHLLATVGDHLGWVCILLSVLEECDKQ